MVNKFKPYFTQNQIKLYIIIYFISIEKQYKINDYFYYYCGKTTAIWIFRLKMIETILQQGLAD